MLVKNYMSGRPIFERFLAEGRLAECGIIDSAAVATYLRQPREPRDSGYIRISELVAERPSSKARRLSTLAWAAR